MTLEKRSGILLFCAALTLAVGSYFLVRGERNSGDRLIASIPPNSFIVASVDLAAIRQSPLGPQLEAAGKLDDSRIKMRCGIDAISRLQSLVFTVPEGDDSGDFGVAMNADISGSELSKCASIIIADRGGQADSTEHGKFTLVEDKQLGVNLHASLALRDGGPFLLGHGKWLTEMMDAVDTNRPLLRSNPIHADLRQSLGPHAILITTTLPASTRERVKHEMELDGDDHLSSDHQTMLAVLGVQSVGFAIDFGLSGGMVTLLAEFRCESSSVCAEVQTILERKKFSWSKNIGLRLGGAGPLIDNMSFERHDAVLRARTKIASNDVTDVIERALEEAKRAPPRHPATTPTPGGSPASSEPQAAIISAKKDAGLASDSGKSPPQ